MGGRGVEGREGREGRGGEGKEKRGGRIKVHYDILTQRTEMKM